MTCKRCEQTTENVAAVTPATAGQVEETVTVAGDAELGHYCGGQ